MINDESTPPLTASRNTILTLIPEIAKVFVIDTDLTYFTVNNEVVLYPMTQGSSIDSSLNTLAVTILERAYKSSCRERLGIMPVSAQSNSKVRRFVPGIRTHTYSLLPRIVYW